MTDADLLRRILGAMRPDYPLDMHDNAWLAAKGLETLEAIEKEAAGVTLDPRPAPDTALREAVMQADDRLSPDATRNVLWANVRAALEANRG